MLRVAVIGCRGIGGRHAQGVVEAGDAAELVAGCDLSEELLTEFADQFKGNFSKVRNRSRGALSRTELR